MKNELPEPWSSAMRKAGMVDPRYGNPSLSRLAEAAGIHTTTVSRLVKQGLMIHNAGMHAVAEALGTSVDEITGWVTGETVVTYIPPAGAERLTHRERKAVDEIILVLLEREKTAHADGDTGQKTDADDAARGADVRTLHPRRANNARSVRAARLKDTDAEGPDSEDRPPQVW